MSPHHVAMCRTCRYVVRKYVDERQAARRASPDGCSLQKLRFVWWIIVARCCTNLFWTMTKIIINIKRRKWIILFMLNNISSFIRLAMPFWPFWVLFDVARRSAHSIGKTNISENYSAQWDTNTVHEVNFWRAIHRLVMLWIKWPVLCSIDINEENDGIIFITILINLSSRQEEITASTLDTTNSPPTTRKTRKIDPIESVRIPCVRWLKMM